MFKILRSLQMNVKLFSWENLNSSLAFKTLITIICAKLKSQNFQAMEYLQFLMILFPLTKKFKLLLYEIYKTNLICIGLIRLILHKLDMKAQYILKMKLKSKWLSSKLIFFLLSKTLKFLEMKMKKYYSEKLIFHKTLRVLIKII